MSMAPLIYLFMFTFVIHASNYHMYYGIAHVFCVRRMSLQPFAWVFQTVLYPSPPLTSPPPPGQAAGSTSGWHTG
jgi:hypothetical protein